MKKCRELGIETLEIRRRNQDLLETFKIVKKLKTEAGRQILSLVPSRANTQTRSTADNWKLEVPRARLEIRKNSFTVRAPALWNNLPTNIKSSDTVQIFKNALKQH